MINCSRCGREMDAPDQSKIASTVPKLSPLQLEAALHWPTVMAFCPECGSEVRRLVEEGKLSICEIHNLLSRESGKKGDRWN